MYDSDRQLPHRKCVGSLSKKYMPNSSGLAIILEEPNIADNMDPGDRVRVYLLVSKTVEFGSEIKSDSQCT